MMSIAEVTTNSSHSCTNKHDRNQPEIETPRSLSSQCNTQKKTIDNLFIPLRTSKTEMYLRIKPTSSMNVKEPDVYTIVNPTTLLTKFPSFDGNGRHFRFAKSCGNGNSKRHVFTKIFGSQTSQTEIFEQSIKHRVVEFLDGKSSTIMSYGTKDSGKTYTIFGTTMSPGIISRSIELIFSMINCTLTPWYKPTCQDTVFNLDESAQMSETRRKARLLNRRSMDANEISLEARISLENSQLDDTTNIEEREQSNGESMHAIWLSFAEIYNGNIYDLLDDTETQSPLRLITDNDGHTYIGNLQRIYATTALEACQILLVGQSRMTARVTLSNPKSSRSHTIFAINLLRYQKDHAAEEVTLSTLTFCDLAGSVQFKAQQNRSYIREASNINNSLLVLGRCLKAVSQDQMAPFRESKLTRIFQNALSGRENLILIVNVVFTSSLFAETQNILNTFCAIARRLLSDSPKKYERSEREFEEIIRGPAANDSDITVPLSVVDISSDKTRMIDYIDAGMYKNLEQQNRELTEKLEITKNDVLQREYAIRQELTDHYSHMFDELEASYKQYTEEIENEGQNLLKWSVRQAGRLYKERYIHNLMGHKKRKRGDSGDYVDDNYALYEELEAENVQITSKVTALKEAVKKLKNDNKMIVCEKNKCSFELALVTEELKKFRELTQIEIRKLGGNSEDDLEDDAVCLMNRLKRLMDEQLKRNEQQLDNMSECICEMKNKDADVTSKVVILEQELSKTVNLLDEALVKTRTLEEDYSQRETYISTLKYHINIQEQKLAELRSQLHNVKNQDARDIKCDRSTNISFDDSTTDSFLDDSSDLAFHTAKDLSQISYVNTSTVDQQEFNNSPIAPTLLVTQMHAESPEKVTIESGIDRNDLHEDSGNLYHMSPVLRSSDKNSSKDDSGISSGLGNESRRSVSIGESTHIHESDEKYTQTCEEANSYAMLKENFEQLKQTDNENLQIVELSKILEIIGNVICVLNEAACVNERKITQYERELLHKGGVLEYIIGEREEITSRCNSLFKMIEDKMQGYKQEIVELTHKLTDTKESESEASKCVERYLELSKSLNVQLSLMRAQLDKISSKCVNEHLPRIESLEEEVLRKTLQINEFDEKIAQAQQTFVKSHELFQKLDDFEIILNRWQRDRNEIHRQLYECLEFLLNLEDKLQKLTVKIARNENKVTLLKTEIHNIIDLNVAYNENACYLSEQIVDVCENINLVKKNLQSYEELCKNLENIVNREIDEFKIRLLDVKNNTTLLNDMFQNEYHDGLSHLNIQLPDKEQKMILFNDNRDNTVTERYEDSMIDSQYEINDKCLRLTQTNKSDHLTKSFITSNEGSLYEVSEFLERFSENQEESKDFLENHEDECSSTNNAYTMFSHMHKETDVLSDQSEDSATSFNEKNITDTKYCQTEDDSVTSNAYVSPSEADSSETEDDFNIKLSDIKNKKKISGGMKIRRTRGKTALSQFADNYIDVESYSESE